MRDLLGSGSRFVLTGTAASLKKTVTVTVYDQFPRMAFFDVAYTNTGGSDLAVERLDESALLHQRLRRIRDARRSGHIKAALMRNGRIGFAAPGLASRRKIFLA